MVTEADFAAFTAVSLVQGSTSNSVIFSPGGSTDRHTLGVFAEAGLEGGGYDWQGAVHALALDRDEDLPNRFRFDSEAGMFCAYGTDLAALHAVAGLVEELIADEALLRASLVKAGEKDLLD
ncbi:hypothetical protein Afil01_40940 [Actinorhabdospora filicis]|uniref:Immunity protein 51 of polymorphic toxin system n=1 Tax=Actinorhabdospora filicis TaxID=1785913 RepID=A0A9W6SNS2_9ACTN|nr:Imm51 family immunity protein [Actinorhabdospora filicis]GLZ79287.1 hypothetical protein Afil01_40940 [Actinorhabdospora filicis]